MSSKKHSRVGNLLWIGWLSAACVPRAPTAGPALATEQVTQLQRPADCTPFVEHFRKITDLTSVGALFEDHGHLTPLVRPSEDSDRAQRILQLLDAPSPPPPRSAPELLHSVQGVSRRHAESVRELLGALEASDIDSYRRVAEKYVENRERLRAIDRDVVRACGIHLTSPKGRLAPKVIQTTVRQNFAGFRKCYETGLARDSQLTGRVAVKFVIAASGSVHDARAIESSESGLVLPDPGTEDFFRRLGFKGSLAAEQAAQVAPLRDRDVVDCIINHYRTLQFPRPEGGIVTVIYPIVLVPTERSPTPR